MNTNYRRQTQSGQFAAVLRWVVVAAFLSITGLSYVYLKNQMYAGGLQKRALERELSDLIVQNNVMQTQINQLTSQDTLRRRLEQGFIKLVPITAQAVVHVHAADTSRWASTDRSTSEYHPVSHDTTVTRR